MHLKFRLKRTFPGANAGFFVRVRTHTRTHHTSQRHVTRFVIISSAHTRAPPFHSMPHPSPTFDRHHHRNGCFAVNVPLVLKSPRTLWAVENVNRTRRNRRMRHWTTVHITHDPPVGRSLTETAFAIGDLVEYSSPASTAIL